MASKLLTVQFLDSMTDRERAVRATLEDLGESQDEVGSLARGALAMELLQPVVDSRKGDKIMIDGHAMQKIDFVERVQRGTVVVQERWRREFESELQARIPAVSRLRVMVPSVIADHNINIEIIDMSEWAVRARCGR